MALLSRSERQQLIDLLLRLPNIGDPAVRGMLLADLPNDLRNNVTLSPAPQTHVTNIVDTINGDAWFQLPDGSWAVTIVVENAVQIVRGSKLAADLNGLLKAVQAHGPLETTSAPPAGSTPNTSAPVPANNTPHAESNLSSTSPAPASPATSNRISQDDRDTLRALIRNLQPIKGQLNARLAFLNDTGLSDTWVSNFDWSGPPATVATQLLNASIDQGIPLQAGRKGYTALGAILDQMLRDELVGMDAGQFIAAAIRRYNLIDLNVAKTSPQLSALLQITPVLIDQPAIERTLHSLDVYLDAKWLRDGVRAAQTVCRIEIPVKTGTVFGTGFLLGPSVVLTNYHVVQALITGEDNGGEIVPPNQLTLRFGYQLSDDGLTVENGQTYKLAQTEWLVDNSPLTELDYALLRVAGTPGNDLLGDKPRSWLIPTQGYAFTSGDPLYIIEHPLLPNSTQTAPLKVVLTPNSVIDESADHSRVSYKTDTEPGASGSPCFSARWELVALHHAGFSDHNEGIPIATIAERPKVNSALRT